MMHMASLFLLAMAISLDSYGVGMTYGMRKVSIPNRSIIIISICSALSLSFGILVGNISEQYIDPLWTGMLGGLILLILGLWTFSSYFRNEEQPKSTDVKTLFKFEIKSIGLVIHILKKPLSADFDNSGTITGLEALFLGIALSLDGFGAGVGAGILHYPASILVGSSFVMSALFMFMGLRTGEYLTNSYAAKILSYIPGVVLIVLGLLKIFH